jgi:hypothetical protein
MEGKAFSAEAIGGEFGFDEELRVVEFGAEAEAAGNSPPRLTGLKLRYFWDRTCPSLFAARVLG